MHSNVAISIEAHMEKKIENDEMGVCEAFFKSFKNYNHGPG